MAVPLQAQAQVPAHSLGSVACLAVEGQLSLLHHLASLAAEVVTRRQIL